MINYIKEIYSLLDSQQRRQVFKLQVMIILMAILDIIGVMSIGPFMAVVGNTSQLQSNGFLAKLYEMSGAQNPQAFLFDMGFAVLVLLAISTSVSIFTTWRVLVFGERLGAELSSRLFSYYMCQPWLFHVNTSSSQLTKQISNDCLRLTKNIINPIFQINARLVLTVLLVTTIFLLNPLASIICVAFFALTYSLMYFFIRKNLFSLGAIVSDSNQRRFKLMSEGFGGIKDSILLHRDAFFSSQFQNAMLDGAAAESKISIVGQIPRFAMELIAFGSIIMFILYLLHSYNNDLGQILPVLTVYAVAGFKLMPAFQHIYISLSGIRSNMPSYEAIRSDMIKSLKCEKLNRAFDDDQDDRKKMVLQQGIRFEEVTFSYPGKDRLALDSADLYFPVNKVIGLVGASGSGKSTAIDLLLGLIIPTSGQIRIDNNPLDDNSRRQWQKNIGYVPQSIFLADSSILENIAFGLPVNEISLDKISRAVTLAHLDELINQLPEGLSTVVGERGVQLSGGQRQRIGIARALYEDPAVLVLDEATSALDGITEKLIMDAIHDFSGKKTIIMIAHRLTTVKPCDVIYVMDNGKIIESGVYDELILRNADFKRMALS